MDDCLPCDSNTVSDVGAETCRACPTGAFDVNNLECANPDGLPASQTLQMPIQVLRIECDQPLCFSCGFMSARLTAEP